MKIEEYDLEGHIEDIKEKIREENLYAGIRTSYYTRKPTKDDKRRYRRLYPHQAIELKGLRVGFYNEPNVNPYYDWGGRVTHRRAYERAWQRGYEDGQKLREKVLETKV